MNKCLILLSFFCVEFKMKIKWNNKQNRTKELEQNVTKSIGIRGKKRNNKSKIMINGINK